MNCYDQYLETLGISDANIDISKMVSEKTADDLARQKFCIVRRIIDPYLVDDLRRFWLDKQDAKSFIYERSWGRKNFSKEFHGRYLRHFEFLWNPPSSRKSLDVLLMLHYGQALLSNHNPFDGLILRPVSPDKAENLLYMAVTQYPLGLGEMVEHVDLNPFMPIHLVVPLTFHGLDYADGGLEIKSDSGDWINVDSQCSPGDVVLFKAAAKHRVKKVIGTGARSGAGRLQMFLIPQKFEEPGTKKWFRQLKEDILGRYKNYRYSKGKDLSDNGKNYK